MAELNRGIASGDGGGATSLSQPIHGRLSFMRMRAGEHFAKKRKKPARKMSEKLGRKRDIQLSRTGGAMTKVPGIYDHKANVFAPTSPAQRKRAGLHSKFYESNFIQRLGHIRSKGDKA